MAYSIPRDAFQLLEEAFNHDRQKAEIFAKVIEISIRSIKYHSPALIVCKKEALKSELYNELRAELATKEFMCAEISTLRAELSSEISVVRLELKQNTLWLKILVGIAIFGLTLFNPAFVKLVELVMSK